MDETIVAPIGLVMGIITACTGRTRAELDFGFSRQFLRQGSLHKEFHSPIQGRSPPLFGRGTNNL